MLHSTLRIANKDFIPSVIRPFLIQSHGVLWLEGAFYPLGLFGGNILTTQTLALTKKRENPEPCWRVGEDKGWLVVVLSVGNR